jgi:hypothetical protein
MGFGFAFLVTTFKKVRTIYIRFREKIIKASAVNARALKSTTAFQSKQNIKMFAFFVFIETSA